MFRKSALPASPQLDSSRYFSAGLLLMCLSSLVLTVDAAKKSPVITLFNHTASGEVFQIVSAAKLSAGCPSMSQLVAEIVGACNVVKGINNVSVDWSLVSSYLGKHVQLLQGVGQAVDSEAVKCMTGFLDAFARDLSAGDQLSTVAVVGLTVAACVILLGVAACGGFGAFMAYRCYQAREEEKGQYSRIY